jgi:hypothetical protein
MSAIAAQFKSLVQLQQNPQKAKEDSRLATH